MISRNNQKFSDPASAMRYLRFKGNVDLGRKKGKRRKGQAALDTGWGAKEAVVFDKKLGVKRNTTLGTTVSIYFCWKLRLVFTFVGNYVKSLFC
jgi:hypothetical protein